MSVLFGGATTSGQNLNSEAVDTLDHYYEASNELAELLRQQDAPYLPRRAKKRRYEGELEDIEASRHYGIPIYDLLAKVKNPQKEVAPPSKRRKRGQAVLLSEKYRPSRFIDLIGSDKTYRHILRWLTQWKPIVFGTDSHDAKMNEHTDQFGRPNRKILLVYGPPGIGKTTAAHVVAKQAGFDVLEINASEERTASIVKDRISSALQSHRVSSQRPVCVVLDEVDGATEHGFVRSLVNLVHADNRVAAGKGRKNDSLLQRPIICVCNDPWTASLAALRPMVELVSFSKQTVAQTASRLESICLEEGLKLSTAEIQQIIQACDCDLRACLNAIDFGSAGSKNQLRSSVAEKQFSSSPATFAEIEASDMDRTLMSCFSSYPQANYIDDMLAKPCAISEWLGLVDSRGHIGGPTDIQSATIHAFGQLFRSAAASSQISKQPNTYETTKRVKGVTEMIRQKAVPKAKSRMNNSMMIKEILPYMTKIACPVTHGVPFEEDKVRIKSACETMESMGVSLKGEKLDDGSLVFLLDPPLEQTCIIDEDEQARVASGKFTARRQMRDQFMLMKKSREKSLTQSNEGLEPAPVAELKVERKIQGNFFGQPIETEADPEDVVPRSAKVWVQYMEGFSNAVRKPVSWSELFKSNA